MSKKDDLARLAPGSPLGNLLLEDAAASKQHGRTTARIGVGGDGNPVVYTTNPATREAVVRAIQERTHVNYMDIPEVSEKDFRKLLRMERPRLRKRALSPGRPRSPATTCAGAWTSRSPWP